MVIRSITYTIDFEKLNNEEYLNDVKNNLDILVTKYMSKGKKIRTIRFNVLPLNDLALNNKEVFFEKILKLSEFSNSLKIRWFNISFNLVSESKNNIDILCEYSYKILSDFRNSFVNLIVAQKYINNYAVKKSSEIIKKSSFLSENGIDNFRLGVSLNIKPNTPFFPFSYSNKVDSFSIALETTKELNNIIDDKFDNDYIKLKEDIIKEFSNDLTLINNTSSKVANELNMTYNGLDLSLSPYPDEDISVIEILNKLGIDNFGSNGTQFLTSYLTSILKELIATTEVKTVGFNGVMYSLLEDKLMCKSHNDGNFSIDSIILYSTVCGCGLDMVPLPHDILEEEIASMVLDVATTSIKLSKPLGVRVLPIPKKVSGELTDLKMDFLTNTKIPNVKHIHINPSLFDIEKFYVKY